MKQVLPEGYNVLQAIPIDKQGINLSLTGGPDEVRQISIVTTRLRLYCFGYMQHRLFSSNTDEVGDFTTTRE